MVPDNVLGNQADIARDKHFYVYVLPITDEACMSTVGGLEYKPYA